MQVKMTACDNPTSVGQDYVGQTADLAVGNIFLFSTMYSSTIEHTHIHENIITIKTLNTVYTFEVV